MVMEHALLKRGADIVGKRTIHFYTLIQDSSKRPRLNPRGPHPEKAGRDLYFPQVQVEIRGYLIPHLLLHPSQPY